jgi:hypothetical protein
VADKRRSLGDALTPDEQEFLDRGTAKPAARKRPPKKQKETSPMKTSAAFKESPPSVSPRPAPRPTQADYALNTRITSDISDGLLRATTERKLRRLEGSNIRDIVEEAMADWLKRNGYLK